MCARRAPMGLGRNAGDDEYTWWWGGVYPEE